MQHTHIIYAGGTFGSHGAPLSPLPADTFLPVLVAQLSKKLPQISTTFLENSLIKDSSTLTPSDFVALYELVLNAYTKGARRFVLITGTDTLSFLAAFFANALADLTDLTLIITGSMQPLFISDNPTYTINDDSDAWANLSEALMASKTHTGVFVQFCHKLMDAADTQKINSKAHDAFMGKLATNTDCQQTDQTVLNNKISQLPTIKHHANHSQITAIYCLPNDTDNLAHQLANISNDAKAVILIGFGAGNIPSSANITAELQRLQQANIPVISSTMCAFGGTNADYAAGAWQYHYGVQSSNLGIAGIYGQLLWQILQPNS